MGLEQGTRQTDKAPELLEFIVSGYGGVVGGEVEIKELGTRDAAQRTMCLQQTKQAV